MPNKRIDQLNPNLENLTGDEFIPIFDTSTNTTERITINTLSEFIDKDIFTTGTTLSGNTIVFDRNDLSGAYDVNLQPILDNYLPLTGGTLTGSLSATTYFGDGSNLSGISFSGQSLSQTLLLGNETGSNDIVVSNNRNIQFINDDFGVVDQISISTNSAKWMMVIDNKLYYNQESQIIEADLNLNVLNNYPFYSIVNVFRYNSNLNRIYVGTNDQIFDKQYIDLNTSQVITVNNIFLGDSKYLDYDQTQNKIYVSNQQNSTIDIYDSEYVYIESIPKFTNILDNSYGWIENNPSNDTIFLSAIEEDPITFIPTPVLLIFDKITKLEIERYYLGPGENTIKKIQYHIDSELVFILQDQYPVKVLQYNGTSYQLLKDLQNSGYSDIRIFNDQVFYVNNNNFSNSYLYTYSINLNYGWVDLSLPNLTNRNYGSFMRALDYQIGNLVINTELVMYHELSGSYYKIKFLSWTNGGNGGGFSYERQLITPTMDEPIITFTKTDYGSEVDVIIPGQLEITRGVEGPIYNSALETEPWEFEGPQGTSWNSEYTIILENYLYNLPQNTGNDFGVLPYNDTYFLGTDLISSNILYKLGDFIEYGILSSNVTQPRTWELPDNSGIIALLSDMPDIKKYGRLIFVDKSYGDNTTAETNNPTKPYFTYLQARNVSVNGDLIVLRPGTYFESIELKDGVDVYCYDNVIINGNIFDNGQSISCNFLGKATIQGAISISNQFRTSMINIEVLDVSFSSNGSAILFSGAGTFILNCRNILATSLVGNGISLNNTISHFFNYSSLSGTFQLNETITFSNGTTAILVQSNPITSTGGSMGIRLLTGILPVNTMDISGSTSLATAKISSDLTIASKSFIKCQNITAGQYTVYLLNYPFSEIIVNDTMALSRSSFNEYANVISTGSGYLGRVKIKSKIITTNNSYCAIFTANNSLDGLLEIESELIESIRPNVPTQLVRSTIFDDNSLTNLLIKSDRITSNGGHIYLNIGNRPTATTQISGNMYSHNNFPIRVNGIKKIIIENSVITKNPELDNNRLVVIGSPIGFSNYFNGQNNNLLIEFDTIKFLKSFNGTPTATEPIIVVDGTTTKTYIKNCEIIGDNLGPTTEAIYADTISEGNIYFKNTITNLPVNINITDTSISGGLFSGDTQLNTLKTIL